MRTSGRRNTLCWHESLQGQIGFPDPSDLVDQDNHSGWARMVVHLDLEIPDVDTFWRTRPPVGRPNDRATIDQLHRITVLGGSVSSHALGGCCPVTGGFVSLLDIRPDTRHQVMYYNVEFADTKGRPRTLGGYKAVFGPAADLWVDTTALLCHVYEGAGSHTGELDDRIIGTGVLKISLADLVRLTLSFRPAEGGVVDGVRDVTVFYAGFARRLWQVYRPGGSGRVPAPVC